MITFILFLTAVFFIFLFAMPWLIILTPFLVPLMYFFVKAYNIITDKV